jgi:hypothetical protein
MRKLVLAGPALALVSMVAATPEALAQRAGGPGGDVGAMRQEAARIAQVYLRRWSSGNATALSDVGLVYAPRVSFYGRFVNQAGLFNEKRRFGQRWPIRRYEHRPGSMRVSCEAGSRACLVRSIIDWTAANPYRGAVSRGSSTFELGIGFSGPKPVLLFERGHRIRSAAN